MGGKGLTPTCDVVLGSDGAVETWEEEDEAVEEPVIEQECRIGDKLRCYVYTCGQETDRGKMAQERGLQGAEHTPELPEQIETKPIPSNEAKGPQFHEYTIGLDFEAHQDRLG
jgi:hypothetical protein